MTDEQIITGLKDLIKDRESFINKEDKSDKDNIFIRDKEVLEKAIEILLEKDKEIEKYKKILANNLASNLNESIKAKNKAENDLEDLNEGWKIEIKKKDKQIDLMAKYINYLSDELVQVTGKNELKFCNGNKCCKDSNYSCEDCIKQYFERKATNNG